MKFIGYTTLTVLKLRRTDMRHAEITEILSEVNTTYLKVIEIISMSV